MPETIFDVFDSDKFFVDRSKWQELVKQDAGTYCTNNVVALYRDAKHVNTLTSPGSINLKGGPVSGTMVSRLMTALLMYQSHRYSDLKCNPKYAISLEDFRQKSETEQTNLINSIYNTMVTAKPLALAAEQMSEPDPVAGGTTKNARPFHGSFRPVKTPGGVEYKTAPDKLYDKPWKDMTIGFRVEGCADDPKEGDFNRITKEGFKPIYHDPVATLLAKGHVIVLQRYA
jgi:hypothetical protein